MKFNPYTNVQYNAGIALYPLLTMLFLLALHYYSGALDWPAEGDVRAQRDFNSAIGMSILTGYFWIALRVLHQNVASSLISLLVKTNQLSRFSVHRNRLSNEFKHHLFNAAVIAILLTVIYCVLEELLTVTQELHVFILTAAAVPFWFFTWLFLFQITSNTRYIINNVLPDTNSTKDYLASLMVLIKLGLTNAIFSMGAIALIPIFWFRKDVPSIDIFILALFSGSFALYLFWPVVKLIAKVRSEKARVLTTLDEKINKAISAYRHKNTDTEYESVELLENEKESIATLSTRVMDVRDWSRIFSCLSAIPFSWSLIKLLEWLVASPFS